MNFMLLILKEIMMIVFFGFMFGLADDRKVIKKYACWVGGHFCIFL